jgi:hypothetical protein
VLDLMKIADLYRQLATDVAAKAGVRKILHDATALADEVEADIEQFLPDPSAPPALAAPGRVGAFLPHDVAKEINAHADELEEAAVRVGAAPNVGKFGDGALLKKFGPLILQAILAALAGA